MIIGTNEFYPIGCDHKKNNGLSAFVFLHGSSGNMVQTEDLFVCEKCGDFRISGMPAANSNYFSYTGHIIIKRSIAAMVRQAAFFNEQSIDDFLNDIKADILELKSIYPDKP